MTSPFPIPLNALRAIEIVARRGALEPAAAELGVTIGAVSQHLRRAEARLGISLFERTSKGLVPTPQLVAQMPALRTGFQTLAGALAALRKEDDDVLTLTVGSVFASRWLITRLGRFKRHPSRYRIPHGGDRQAHRPQPQRYRLRYPLRHWAVAGDAVRSYRRHAVGAVLCAGDC